MGQDERLLADIITFAKIKGVSEKKRKKTTEERREGDTFIQRAKKEKKEGKRKQLAERIGKKRWLADPKVTEPSNWRGPRGTGRGR